MSSLCTRLPINGHILGRSAKQASLFDFLFVWFFLKKIANTHCLTESLALKKFVNVSKLHPVASLILLYNYVFILAMLKKSSSQTLQAVRPVQ